MEPHVMKKMNSLANQYITTKDERHFEELYELFKQEYKNTYRKVARTCFRNGDDSEVESLYMNVLFNTLQKYEPETNFCLMLSKSLKNLRIDMHREYQKKETYEHKKKDEEGNLTDPTPLLQDPFHLEDFVTDNLTKKSHIEKKHELIQHFKDQTTDPTTALIIEKMLNHENPNSIAKTLKLDRTQVIRKLKKLKKLYDPKKFGKDPKVYCAI